MICNALCLIASFAIGSAQAQTPASASASMTSESPGRIDINRVELAELQARLGLSTTELQAIAKWRQLHGDFHSDQDFTALKELTPAHMKLLQDRSVFTLEPGAPTLGQSPSTTPRVKSEDTTGDQRAPANPTELATPRK